MADQKVSDLPALNGADVDAADLLYIVDSSAGSAGSKKITVGQYQLAPVSGGTANGVVYLNGSKVVTTGLGLTFDGSRLLVDSASAGLMAAYNSTNANGGYIELRSSSTVYGDIGTAAQIVGGSASDFSLNARGSRNLIFGTNNTERARITSGGDFGINGTPPNDSQFYSKNAGSFRFAGSFENHSASGWGVSIGTASTVLAHFYPNAARTGGPVGSITTNGSSTSYVTSSDRRLKENIAPAADAGPVIDAIEVIQHDWKVGGHTRFGVIAQDLNAVAPEAVSAGDDGDEIEKTWGVDYSKLVPMLIKEVQSLRARVAALESA